MNERIKELMLESGTEEWLVNATPGNAPECTISALRIKEKFAELIVRDVVATVKRTQVTSPDFEWAILNNYDLEIAE